MSLSTPLKTKISTWKNFLRLFAVRPEETSLYIPTRRPLLKGDEVPLILFVPEGEPMALIVRVVHIFGDSAGGQKGLGVTISRLTKEQNSRLQQLYNLARARVAAQTAPNAAAAGQARAGDAAVRPAQPRRPAQGGHAGQQSPPAAKDVITAPTGKLNYTFAHPSLLHAPAKPEMPIVGMDLGTTRSSVAVVENNEVLVLQAQNGLWDIPSVVGFTEVGDPVVGTDAREMFIIDPSHAIVSPKRLLGRKYQARDLEPFLAGMAMSHSEAPNGEVLLHPRGKTLTVPQVCAPLLFQMRVMAQEYLGQAINEVVITAPVSFDERRRKSLRDAASLAGLRITDIIEEPNAAVMAHHFDDAFHGLVAVYDFGGGTFDFSLVEVGRNKLDVVATSGDTWLGGDDFDLVLANAAANAFWRENKIEIRNDVVRWQRLLIAAEKAKRELSFKEDTVLGLPDAALTSRGPIALRFPVTRIQFNELSRELIERSLDTCRDTLDLQDLKPEAVDTIYLSGGTSAIPAIRKAIEEMFGKQARTAIPPERAVVLGAALFAAQHYHIRRVRKG